MALKLTNNNNLPGVLGGALAPLKKAFFVALGFTLYPGMMAYFHDGTGETVRPPRNNLTVVTWSAAPSSGDTLTMTLNGVLLTQAWDTDAATTMTALAAKADAEPNIASAVKSSDNKSITITASAGYECIVSTAANSDGVTTVQVLPDTTDTPAGMVLSERREAIGGVLKFEAPAIVTLLIDGDSCTAGVGGESAATYDINSDVHVRVVQGNTANGEYKGQICCSRGPATGVGYASAAVSMLSFGGAGTKGDYEDIQVTKGA